MITNLLDLLIPARCAACGARGEPCCPKCHGVWGGLRQVHRVPTEDLAPVYALARYHGVARKLLIAYKERGRRDLAPALGRAVADALPGLPGIRAPVCLVPVPSRTPVARSRGGPHVRRFAEAAARLLTARGHPAGVADALSLSGGTRDAVGLSRAQRLANLTGRVRFHAGARPSPSASVVVLDDVITTGATAAACVRALAAHDVRTEVVLTLLAAG